jgi:hypothetical protein
VKKEEYRRQNTGEEKGTVEVAIDMRKLDDL